MQKPPCLINEGNVGQLTNEVGGVCSSQQQLTSQLACLVPSVLRRRGRSTGTQKWREGGMEGGREGGREGEGEEGERKGMREEKEGGWGSSEGKERRKNVEGKGEMKG